MQLAPRTPSPMSPRRRASLLSRIAPVLGAALLVACGSDTQGESGTTGKTVIVKTRGVGDLTARSFTSGRGWKIELSKAAVAVGGFYFFDGDPAFVQRVPVERPAERLAKFLGLGIAHAHPGHYIAGNAEGEMNTPSSIDLLQDSVELPDGNGVTGSWNSARWTVPKTTPVGPAAGMLGSHVAFAAGSATKDATTVYFSVTADYDDVAANAANGEIDGCILDGGTVTGDGVITATVDMKVWFNLADFTAIDPGTADAPTVLVATDQPHKAFAQGVEQLSAYHFAFTSK